MNKGLPDGKLPADLLRRLLTQLDVDDKDVVIAGRVGEDAAVIARGDQYLVLSADPITFAAERIGWYAVQVNANDIAAMGAKPQYFLSTILLPSGQATESSVEQIMREINAACRELGCLAVGGHTEVTTGLSRPIVSGAMIGEVDKQQLKTSAGSKSGDMLVLTGGIAIEATAILARERAEVVREEFGEKFQAKAALFLEDPGISVVTAGVTAATIPGVNAMHDVTEGGLATASWELAEASDVGLVIQDSEIPRYWESSELARVFEFDLLGAIGSGALLMSVEEEHTGALIEAMAKVGVETHVIGRVVNKDQSLVLRKGGEDRPLPRYSLDEIARIL